MIEGLEPAEPVPVAERARRGGRAGKRASAGTHFEQPPFRQRHAGRRRGRELFRAAAVIPKARRIERKLHVMREIDPAPRTGDLFADMRYKGLAMAQRFRAWNGQWCHIEWIIMPGWNPA